MSNVTPPTEKEKRNMKINKIILGITFVLGLGMWIMIPSEPEYTPERQAQIAKAELKEQEEKKQKLAAAGAYNVSKELVKARLKHPKTASFSWAFDSKFNEETKVWIIDATVTYKNSFNVEIEKEYQALVNMDKNGLTGKGAIKFKK